MTGPKPFTRGLPQRHNCDPNNPYEKFLWCFVALPGVQGGPLIMPIDYYQHVSKHLDELGLDFVREPTKKYQPPLEHELVLPRSCAGKWVPVDTPDRDPRAPVERFCDAMTGVQLKALFDELWRRHSPAQRAELLGDNRAELELDDDPT